MKLYNKTLLYKGFFLFSLLILFSVGCSSPRPAIDVSDYILMPHGKPVLGNDGLTAFIFENNPKKVPFRQFVGNKYGAGTYTDVEYWVTVHGKKFKVYVYESAEIEKFFDTSTFIASNVEPENSIVGSKEKFIALSVINEYNEDCLADGSLYQNMVINYLRNLKKEYYTH